MVTLVRLVKVQAESRRGSANSSPRSYRRGLGLPQRVLRFFNAAHRSLATPTAHTDNTLFRERVYRAVAYEKVVPAARLSALHLPSSPIWTERNRTTVAWKATS